MTKYLDPFVTVGPKPEEYMPSEKEVQRMTDLLKAAQAVQPAPTPRTDSTVHDCAIVRKVIPVQIEKEQN